MFFVSEQSDWVEFTANVQLVYEQPSMRQHIANLLTQQEVVEAVKTLRFQFLEGGIIQVQPPEWNNVTISALQVVSAQWKGDRAAFLSAVFKICHCFDVKPWLKQPQPSGLRHMLARKLCG